MRTIEEIKGAISSADAGVKEYTSIININTRRRDALRIIITSVSMAKETADTLWELYDEVSGDIEDAESMLNYYLKTSQKLVEELNEAQKEGETW